jgi:asparaginyl-tRNA synthetase
VRSAAARAIHDFFGARGFTFLHAPIITLSDAEGAGQMFGLDFFGQPAHLSVSGQLEAEIAALALCDVYTFGPTFRAENSNTSRHLAEFWMVEPEMAFCDLDGNAALAEAFLKHLFARVLEDCAEDMAFFDERIQPGALETLRHVVEAPFERLSYGEAIRILEASGERFEFPVRWGADLQSEHERFLAEKHVGRPLVVTDYPAAIKAFYMYLNDDERTVRAMDVLVPRIGEIIGGSQREHRHDVLARRLDALGLPREPYWWYLDLRRYGSVPHAGFGLGFERLVQFATGMANIRDVIPFPRVPGYVEF